ncbi:YoaK family protein [Nocardia sp. alder85J]|uniref:YoaK family protein n=1 Tax=Nocardia sp. alder85J TaxID=2862949 RepID=UPI001CD28F4D|nr:YoaK family protein [Nocardia sp. alder85J]MCX4098718.1 YoaK family protein [Nocardia sp. alder85J]
MAAPGLPVARRWAVAALLLLTVATGSVDAVSYLALGHVFVANMTGNIVFLGFGLDPGSGLSAAASLVAIAGFLAGSLLGGRAGSHLHDRPRRWLTGVFGLQAVVMAVAAVLTGAGVLGGSRPGTYGLLVVLAVCFGLQNATVRRLAPPDLTTTVLTLTITGLAADSVLGGGTGAKPGRRLGSIAAMLCGAGGGAVLLRLSPAAAIAAGAGLVAVAAGVFHYAPEPDPSPAAAHPGTTEEMGIRP